MSERKETMEDYAAELEASYEILEGNSSAFDESEEDGIWAEFDHMRREKEVVKVKISEVVKGGVVTSLEETRAFIPASQLADHYVEKLEDWVGRSVEAMIITVDPEKKRLVLSSREVEKQKKQQERDKKLATLKVGDVVEGTVASLKNYGAFVTISEGVEGLLHISQITTKRIKHPGAVLKEGQTVKVKILSVENGKISLSMKELLEEQEEKEAHEYYDYKESGALTSGLGELLKGIKLN